MLILVDRDELRMVAAAGNRKWINLVGYCDFPGKRLVVVDSLEGKTWTVFDEEEMATLYTNMSGQPAPAYAEAVAQLRAYSDAWPAYPKSEAELEREAEKIFQEEQNEYSPAESAFDMQTGQNSQVMREAHQATIEAVEMANEALSPEQRAAAIQQAPTSAPKPKKEAGEAPVPRQGITKKIWEIADDLLAVTGSVGNIKEFRKEVIKRAAAIGANEGTAATQFGKWKSSKGIA